MAETNLGRKNHRLKIVDRAFNGRWRVADIRAMTKWENGKYKMTYKYLAGALNISVDRLRRILKRPDETIVDIPRGNVVDQFDSTIGFMSPAVDRIRKQLIESPGKSAHWTGDIISGIRRFRASK